MRFFIIFFIFLEGVLMSAELSSVKVKEVEVPVIFEKSDNIPIVHMQIVFKNSGYIYDTKKGIAQISSKILNEGTKKDGSVEFARKLDSRAINISVHAGSETLVIDISSLKSEFKKALDLASSLLEDPNITKEALSKIKIELNALISRKESDFDYSANRILLETIFKDTPLEHPSFGTKESIEKIDIKDIKKYLKSNIVIDSAIVVVGGDLSKEEAKNYSKNILKNLQRGEVVDELYFAPKSEGDVVRNYKDTKQAYIYFGAPLHLKSIKDDHYKAKVAAFILGSSGFGSRMMEEVRVKRGLAYSAYMRFNINKSHSYAFGYLQTKIENEHEAIKIVKDVVEDFVEKGATQKELDSAKNFLLGSEPLRNELLSQRLSVAFSDYYKGLPLGYREEELGKIKELELEELNSFIKEHKEMENLTFSIITESPKESEK